MLPWQESNTQYASSCLFTLRYELFSGKGTRLTVQVMWYNVAMQPAGPATPAARVVLETRSDSGYHGLPLAILDCLVAL